MGGWDQYGKYMKLYAGTKAEEHFEKALATCGVPYRWQMPLGRYVLDFALPRDRVVIEVDGDSHLRPEQIAKDAERTAWLEARGWRVVRVWNEDVWRDVVGAVVRCMEAAGLPHRPQTLTSVPSEVVTVATATPATEKCQPAGSDSTRARSAQRPRARRRTAQ